MKLNIELIPALKDNYIALLIDSETSSCVAIDPSEAEPVLEVLEERKLQLREVWNTHHHWDHVGGNEVLKQKTGARVLCSQHDRPRIPAADYGFAPSETHGFGSLNFQVLTIPGHTLGHIAFYSPQANCVFTGDTLFSMGCGRIFEGSPEQMYRSLQTLLELPDATQIYCGHEYTETNLNFALSLEPQNAELLAYQTTVESKRREGRPSLPSSLSLEKQLNPFLKARTSKEFAKLREQKDNF